MLNVLQTPVEGQAADVVCSSRAVTVACETLCLWGRVIAESGCLGGEPGQSVGQSQPLHTTGRDLGQWSSIRPGCGCDVCPGREGWDNVRTRLVLGGHGDE